MQAQDLDPHMSAEPGTSHILSLSLCIPFCYAQQGHPKMSSLSILGIRRFA